MFLSFDYWSLLLKSADILLLRQSHLPILISYMSIKIAGCEYLHQECPFGVEVNCLAYLRVLSFVI